MKKKIFSVLMAMALAITITACGSPSKDAAATTDVPEKVTNEAVVEEDSEAEEEPVVDEETEVEEEVQEEAEAEKEKEAETAVEDASSSTETMVEDVSSSAETAPEAEAKSSPVEDFNAMSSATAQAANLISDVSMSNSAVEPASQAATTEVQSAIETAAVSTPAPAAPAPEPAPEPVVSEPAPEEVQMGPPYFIEVDRAANLVRVWCNQDAAGNWTTLVREMICSTGRAGHETPTGLYSIFEHTDGGGAHLMVDGTYGRYCMRWKSGGYMFHSVCYSSPGAAEPLAQEVADLGSSVSRGCVRLSVENAQWLYNTMPNGTTVYVH